ncbi:MAG: hypothetical protein UY70_C0004G0003 [Candidatus Kaiserbacteria bacterium GW2011_GWB1_52_6]|uniref:Peptidase C39 domain-containing protein n=1 Tax=Candidatus Kaiserbacteria bacterium GW2011_GWB1_52_6 TaxID=1618674 RepID=A0A0G2A6R5_9BACT|nr:MAG: hypothetical protein UY70_C0004G0003 [Candidatus Kaiserbacteria bacterium GW2011_GWB1_52_6]
MAEQAPLHVPFSYQSESFNCGPHTLRLVMQFLGNDVDESKLREYGKTTIEEGTSCENMTRAARLAHFWAYGSFDGKIEDLEHFFKLGYPAIVHLFNPEWPDFGYGDFDRSHYDTRDDHIVRAVEVAVTEVGPLWIKQMDNRGIAEKFENRIGLRLVRHRARPGAARPSSSERSAHAPQG